MNSGVSLNSESLPPNQQRRGWGLNPILTFTCLTGKPLRFCRLICVHRVSPAGSSKWGPSARQKFLITNFFGSTFNFKGIKSFTNLSFSRRLYECPMILFRCFSLFPRVFSTWASCSKASVVPKNIGLSRTCFPADRLWFSPRYWIV